MNPFLCERCGRDLESDDAISIIEGVCCACRRVDAQEQLRTGARRVPPTPPVAPPPRLPPRLPLRRPAPRPPKNADVRPRSSSPVRPTVVKPSSSVEPLPSPRLRLRRRDLAIGVGFGLLTTFIITGYMLTQTKKPAHFALHDNARSGDMPVRLTVKPAWAEVSLDDQPVGSPSEGGQLRFTLPPDDGALHWLTVAAEGYHPVRRPLTVFDGIGDITIELVRKPIEVAVRSEPPNAEVWIDDQYKGNTPLDITLLPWDAATLSLKRDGYQIVHRPIKPPAQGNRLELDFALERAGVMVRVETQPPGAIVAVDGQIAGATPLDLPMAAEHHGKEIEITATLAGYNPASHRVRLPSESDGEPIIARLDLTRPEAELIVASRPPGAEVFVGGKSVGSAPATIRLGPQHAGQRVTVEGRIPGSYSGKTKVLVPPAGQKSEVTLELEMTGQRVVFLVLAPTGTGTDHMLLTDQLIEQIHRLDEQQNFTVLACTIEGLRAWPGLGQTAPATSDNKIRAYDHVRGIRPSARGAAAQAMREALRVNPNTIWLFAGPRLVTEDLDPLGEPAAPGAPVVNVVQIAARNRPIWLENFVSQRGGSMTIIESAPTRLLAQDRATID